jgi:hypothetical protein
MFTLLVVAFYKICVHRAGPRLVGASGTLIIWRPRQKNNSLPLKTKFFDLFLPREGLAKMFKARDQVANNLLRNFFGVSSLSLVAPYLLLLQ